MRVLMRRPRRFLDAGVERMLDLGSEYDLPIVVAESLVATGAAVVVEQVVLAAPEIKPMRPPEAKQARR